FPSAGATSADATQQPRASLRATTPRTPDPLLAKYARTIVYRRSPGTAATACRPGSVSVGSRCGQVGGQLRACRPPAAGLTLTRQRWARSMAQACRPMPVGHGQVDTVSLLHLLLQPPSAPGDCRASLGFSNLSSVTRRQGLV